MSDLPTTERLAKDLEACRKAVHRDNHPFLDTMILSARAGYYDDFKTPLDFPLRQLVADAQKIGLTDIAQWAIDGRYDATQEEAKAWWNNEGKDALPELNY